MLKYLKLFNEHSNYEAFRETSDFLKPNVSYCITENHVHYNPMDLRVSGKFTVPSRLFDVRQGDDSGGGDSPKIARFATRSLNSSSCYGLDSGIRFGGNPEIKYNDNDQTPILDIFKFNEQPTIIDSADGKEYRYVRFSFGYIPIDENGDCFDVGTEINPDDGETYYYAANINQISARISSDGVLETGKYSMNKNDEWVFNPSNIPIVTVRQNFNLIKWNDDLGITEYVKTDVNCVYCDSQNYEPLLTEDYIWHGNFIFSESTDYANLIIPMNNFKTAQELKRVFTYVAIDGVEINLDELYKNGGWHTLEEGEHTILYRLNRDLMYGGYLMPGLFTAVPIEELSLDRRIKGTWLYYDENSYNTYKTAFDMCALLGTDEATIEKVCTLRPLVWEEDENGQKVPANTSKVKKIVFECEFEDDDDIIYDSKYGNGVCNGTYFAIHDGVVGMHGCVYQSDDGPIANMA